ncbi:MAG: biotin/lipoate A/B protein ligase family protein [Pseudomonadota bacterium]
MAEDEAVFLLSRRRPSPTVRFYSWLVPAVSVGYFQQVDRDIDLAACRRRCVDIVRRPTGGKAVFHEHDLTYAMVGLEQRDGFPADILGTYRRISRCLIRGLREMGIEAQVTEEGRALPETPVKASCFSAPSRYELLVQGRKICGSAQVRSHGSFLQHGSLLLAFDPLRTGELLLTHPEERDQQIARLRQSVTSLRDEGVPLPDMKALCGIMKTGFEAALDICLEEGALTPDEEALKEHLFKDKYTNDSWNLEGRTGRWIWENS